MNNIKMITLFHPHDKTPFMICIVNKVEDTELGLKLTIENGNNICVNNYSHYLLSESASRCDNDRLKLFIFAWFQNLHRLVKKL